MKVDLCLNPRVFTKDEVLSKIPEMQEIMEWRTVHLACLYSVVPQELGDKLVAMAGMRNILVHLYWDIDYHRLCQALTSQLFDFDEYARYIFDFVAKEGGEE